MFCQIDLYRAEAVRYVPKWAWAVLCLISIPLGGIIYLSIGKVRGHPAHESRPPQAAPHRSHSAPATLPNDLRGAIEIDGLTKRFGSLTALDDLSFTVQPGRVTGFLGPNGAGNPVTKLWPSFPQDDSRWIGRRSATSTWAGIAVAMGLYLLKEKPTHLNDVFHAGTGATRQLWALPDDAVLSINRQLGFHASVTTKTWQVAADRARTYLSA